MKYSVTIAEYDQGLDHAAAGLGPVDREALAAARRSYIAAAARLDAEEAGPTSKGHLAAARRIYRLAATELHAAEAITDIKG